MSVEISKVEDKEIKRVDEVENDIACASLLLKSHESNQLQVSR